MNSTLAQFARQQIKTKLILCTDQEKHSFKLMYSHKNLDMPIDDVVDGMLDEKLDWALSQVERTIAKRANYA